VKPARRAYNRLLGLGFRLLYNELAWTYDAVSWGVSLGQWRSWQRASLAHLVGPRVLEIAFGTGNLQLDLHAAGCCAEAYGIDLSPHMVRITRRKLSRHGIDPRICRASASALPFATGTFDSLLATFPTPFIRAPQVLAELARVLRPGGQLVIVDGAWLLRPQLAAHFIDWLYQATGQSAELGASSLGWLERAGWRATERLEAGHRAVVHLILAQPPGGPGTLRNGSVPVALPYKSILDYNEV
jgi:ubiquinone/menaquinone biosynthesis C-methylase UbiE